jgi:hypothetical protein
MTAQSLSASIMLKMSVARARFRAWKAVWRYPSTIGRASKDATSMCSMGLESSCSLVIFDMGFALENGCVRTRRAFAGNRETRRARRFAPPRDRLSPPPLARGGKPGKDMGQSSR